MDGLAFQLVNGCLWLSSTLTLMASFSHQINVTRKFMTICKTVEDGKLQSQNVGLKLRSELMSFKRNLNQSKT